MLSVAGHRDNIGPHSSHALSRRYYMKRLLVAFILCVIPLVSQAKALAYTDNAAGRRIVITDQPCTDGMAAYTIDRQGESHIGCWWSQGNKYIYIKWADLPMIMKYPIAVWRTTEPPL